ncbi:MAG: MFS transporter [Acidimicrobiales bacterium]
MSAGSRATATPRLSGTLVNLVTVCAGASVANLYYAQPLLHHVATEFSVGTAVAATVVTCTQAGYAAALLLVVPLGDLHPRRRLVVGVYALAAAALVVCAAAPGLWLFELGAIVAGGGSVAGQVLLPLVADVAVPARRARIMARIMTGMLVGILLARTLAGLMAEAAGWRSIYWLSAGLMVAASVLLGRAIPREAPRPHVAYLRLVRTSLRLLVEEPLLRRRAWQGGWSFAAFNVLWTALAFLLSGAPYHYSSAVIGLFGLAGVGGALGANAAGRLADAQRASRTIVVAAVLVIGSFALLAAGRSSLGFLLAGIVVLDVGTQGMQLTNWSVIYALRPDARSRINSAYMVCYFAGGAIGSGSAGAVLAASGWYGACLLGAGFGVLTAAASVLDRVRPVAPVGAGAPAGAGAGAGA